jgi:hypothetical protein
MKGLTNSSAWAMVYEKCPNSMVNEGPNREKFIRLAEKRTQKAIETITLIGKLSNKSNYSYNEDDVKKIRKALLDAVNDAISKFIVTTTTSGTFTLGK